MGRDADAVDGRQGPVHDPDDLGDGNRFGRPGQSVSALGPLAAAQIAGPLELQQDLLEKPFGDVLSGRNVADVLGVVGEAQGQLEHGPAGVFASRRQPHCASIRIVD